MKKRERFSIIAAAVMLLSISNPAVADPKNQDFQPPQLSQVETSFISPIARSEAYELLSLANPDSPIEILFASNDWVGGVVLSNGPDSLELLEDYLSNSPAASSHHSIVAVISEVSLVESSVLNQYDVRERQVPVRVSTQAPRKDQVNMPGNTPKAGPLEPRVPRTGIFRQRRLQGVVESTEHQFIGLGKSSYPADIRYVDMTQGQGATARPHYGYEHDYKVTNNGYVATTDYAWASNLPGAYKDTRVQDGSDTLDFTIGSAFTWLLDYSKIYEIQTTVPAGSAAWLSEARLTGSVLPNDRGCRWPVNAHTLVPYTTHGDPWCFGLTGSALDISFISLTPFTIRSSGTCWHWTYAQGAIPC